MMIENNMAKKGGREATDKLVVPNERDINMEDGKTLALYLLWGHYG